MFTRQTNLNTHLRREKPCTCDICGKAFTRKNDLNCHKKTHTINRDFRCRGKLWDLLCEDEWGCDKGFARAGGLSKHFGSKAGRECIRLYLEQRRLMEDYSRPEPQDVAHALQRLATEDRIIDAALRDFPELAALYGGALKRTLPNVEASEAKTEHTDLAANLHETGQ